MIYKEKEIPTPTLGSCLPDLNELQRRLRSQQEHHKNRKLTGYKSACNVWMDYKLYTKKDRAWQSLQCWRAIALYHIRIKEIARLARTSYRTCQYFLHAPSRVGFISAGRIVTATKILMGHRLLWLEETFEDTWEKWHDCDPRYINKGLFKTLTDGKCTTTRVMEPKTTLNTLTQRE